MKTHQKNLMATGHSVSSVMKTITATRPVPALVAGQAALDNIMSDLTTFAALQAEPITGKTQDRNNVFTAAAEVTSIIARLTLGYALSRELPDLAAHVDLPASRLSRARFIQRLQAMQQVHDAAAGVIDQLAEAHVTPEMLAAQQAKIDAAKAVLSLPRSTIAARRVVTEKLGLGFRKLNRVLRYQLDPQMELLRETDPDAYALYRAARLVIDRPGESRRVAEDSAPASTASQPTNSTPSAHPLAA
jgi:hypothetical protein